MNRIISLLLIFVLTFEQAAFARVGSNKAAYIGGTAAEFKNAEDPVKGELRTDDEKELVFVYKKSRKFTIPYENIIDLEYGQKVGRRVGASIATAILLTPVALFMLFSKKRKHYLTIGYTDAKGKEQVAVFEVGKKRIRTLLPILETRTGKKIIYQDEEAKKSGKSVN